MKYFNSGLLKMPFPKDKAFCKIKYNSRVMLFPLRLLTIPSSPEQFAFKSCLINNTQMVTKN